VYLSGPPGHLLGTAAGGGTKMRNGGLAQVMKASKQQPVLMGDGINNQMERMNAVQYQFNNTIKVGCWSLGI